MCIYRSVCVFVCAGNGPLMKSTPRCVVVHYTWLRRFFVQFVHIITLSRCFCMASVSACGQMRRSFDAPKCTHPITSRHHFDPYSRAQYTRGHLWCGFVDSRARARPSAGGSSAISARFENFMRYCSSCCFFFGATIRNIHTRDSLGFTILMRTFRIKHIATNKFECVEYYEIMFSSSAWKKRTLKSIDIIYMHTYMHTEWPFREMNSSRLR